MNFDRWLVVESVPGMESELLSDIEAKRLVELGVGDTDIKTRISDNIGIAAVENVLASKIRLCRKEVRGPGGKKRKKIEVEVIPLNIREFYQDPQLCGLYYIQECVVDKHELLKMSDDEPSKTKPFRKDVVKKLESGFRENDQDEKQDQGNDIHQPRISRRVGVVIHEFWCTILDDDGTIMEWKRDDGSTFPLENVMVTMANEQFLLHDPVQNPRWSGNNPFVVTRLLRTNKNAYGKSILSAGVDINRAQDELMSALTDAALSAAFDVKVLKAHGLADPKQVSGGIRPASTLIQNSSLPPGDKLLDVVRTGEVPQGAFQIYGELQRSGAENMLSNEINLSGALPSKQVRATELTAAQSVINGLFESLAADVEDIYLERLIEEIYQEMLQAAKELSDEDLKYVFLGDEGRMAAFKAAKAKDIFDELSHSFRFKGKGLRGLASNTRQAQMLVNIMSMAASNPMINDALERSGFSIPLMFERIIRGFNLDADEFKDKGSAEFARLRQLIREQALAMAEAQGGGAGRPGGMGAQAQQNAPQGEGPSETEPGNGAEGMY
jgi:hypothetical protein